MRMPLLSTTSTSLPACRANRSADRPWNDNATALSGKAHKPDKSAAGTEAGVS